MTDELRSEIDSLKEAVRLLTNAVKILTDQDERAQEFINKVDELLTQSKEATAEAVYRLGD